MRVQNFPKTVAKLARQKVNWVKGKIDSLEYRLAGEGRVQEKYYRLHGTVFLVRVLSPEHFRVSIDGERFEDAFSPEQIPVVLSGAFDRACIQSGIESTSARFKTTGQEENLNRPRLAAISTAFDRFKTAGEEDAVFSKRPEAPSTAFDRFKSLERE